MPTRYDMDVSYLQNEDQTMARVGKTKPKEKTVAPVVVSAPEPVVSAFSTGDHITHAMFGDGDVEAVSDNTLTIAFAKFGTKKVLDSYVKRAPRA